MAPSPLSSPLVSSAFVLHDADFPPLSPVCPGTQIQQALSHPTTGGAISGRHGPRLAPTIGGFGRANRVQCVDPGSDAKAPLGRHTTVSADIPAWGTTHHFHILIFGGVVPMVTGKMPFLPTCH